MEARDLIFQVIVIGGGHAGVEAAWAAANLLPVAPNHAPTVALVTLDPAKIGVMSCNPAIGGLAKGQIVREIDALGGVMGLATDATGIQFKVLNASKGAAVRGPRAQCDKHAYARVVQALLASRPEIRVIAGAVEDFIVESGHIIAVRIGPSPTSRPLPMNSACDAAREFDRRGGLSAHGLTAMVDDAARPRMLRAPAVVLTTGTFMRGLMHTGESRTPGGRHGEAAATAVSSSLVRLGFELGRLKTGTPPRLKRSTIDWEALPAQLGDALPTPFSDLSAASAPADAPLLGAAPSLTRFPVLPQVECRVTSTNAAAHDAIRANLHRAPMYSGQIESIGPRYCPSIEDKVVRFADRHSHNVFLEPESLDDDSVYCNGISTSLPADVQNLIVHAMPGCERAHIYRYGYAVEYDMVRPHQIGATAQTKLIAGLFLAGQINGTSGYEEAAAQGVVAGINAARLALGHEPITIGRDQAYIGVLMDDLVTKTPVEPYRMFTSRAEHRLLLRADNAADRLTPLADRLGLLASTELGCRRSDLFAKRRAELAQLEARIGRVRVDNIPLAEVLRRPETTADWLAELLAESDPAAAFSRAAVATAHTDAFYSAYIDRQHAEVRRHAELERRRIPTSLDFASLSNLRAEARQALTRFKPETFGQAGRLEGITPADLTLLAVLVRRAATIQ
ncbi:MAG: tRNA uridine-5-carboxymethylaminomethyl(34) synthesis enzyme MnmG [Phycisphaerales bacterium]|nr:tRNA uridine-5-carboxymethylaminomethyl(34) synthesis enzyme MnmG [Phycisphaerales bacterium]